MNVFNDLLRIVITNNPQCKSVLTSSLNLDAIHVAHLQSYKTYVHHKPSELEQGPQADGSTDLQNNSSIKYSQNARCQRQDGKPSPQKIHNYQELDNEHRVGHQSVVTGDSIDYLITTPPVSRALDIPKEIERKWEDNLLVLYPLLSQWSDFSTLIKVARDFRAPDVGAVKIVVPEGVPGNVVPRFVICLTEYSRSQTII